MNQCKTCDFWGEFGTQESFGICHHPKLADLGAVRGQGPDVLGYEFDEGVAILTGPEFGCIHHEERP